MPKTVPVVDAATEPSFAGFAFVAAVSAVPSGLMSRRRIVVGFVGRLAVAAAAGWRR